MTCSPVMEFKAEIKEVKSTKKPSTDVEYRIVLITDSKQVMRLGMLDGNQIVNVTIGLESAP